MKYKKFRNGLIINNKIIIDWSAKSGCTVLCKMIFDYLGISKEPDKLNLSIHKYRQNYFYQKYGRVRLSQLLDSNIIKIKLVRNPYSRAVSSYLHIMKTYISKKYFDHQDLSFLEYLDLIKNKKVEPNPHYGLQKLAIENKRDIFNNIIKIENLNKNLYIFSQYGLKLKLIHSSRHHNNIKLVKNAYYGNMKYSKLVKFYPNNTYPSYNTFYNNKTKKLVTEIYQEDITTYNYTFDEFLKSSFNTY